MTQRLPMHSCMAATHCMEVTHELLCIDGGVEAYEDLYLKISLEHDPDGNDWNWVDAVLAQEAPAPQIGFFPQELSEKNPLLNLGWEQIWE